MRLAATLLCLAAPAFGWNATGHRVIAAIAYDHLTPQAKLRVDALLRQHPDYTALLSGDPADRARAAFLAASMWPDAIRSDGRFYDDTRASAKPTPLLPGFPSMARHTNWHYINVPFSPDGTPLEPVQPPNALTELQRILKEIGQPGPVAPYDLPWLMHIAGDLHQPLHCVSRFVKSGPKGDAGGNGVFVTTGAGDPRTLHALWDDAGGRDASGAYVDHLATEITAEFTQGHGPRPRVSRNPHKWVEEGFELARREVYSFGFESGSRDHPIALPQQYEANAHRIARTRLALAGFRLAYVLNERLK